MFILDSLLIGSLRFILDNIVAAAETESQDDSALREQLLEAEMRLELGEITGDEFAEIERGVVTAMREMKGQQQGALTMSPTDRIIGVDVETSCLPTFQRSSSSRAKAASARRRARPRGR